MADLATFEPGGYHYIPGKFQYSAGVRAADGFAIERVSFRSPPPLDEGFAAVEALLAERGRPSTAFCACELRSPAPFSEDGFVEFNRGYVTTLAAWGIYDEDSETNPVARSNVCPEADPPAEPVLSSFCFTVPAGHTDAGGVDFVISGSGEAPEGRGRYGEFVVRAGDTSAEAMGDKAAAVLGELERRMACVAVDWSHTTAVQAYTVFDFPGTFASQIVSRGASRNGLTWHHSRPPVVGLDFEMDCRSVTVERWI